jgi:cytochrome c-type biogenesis protein CcmH
MSMIGFIAGALTTLISLIALSPWLRKMSNWAFVTAEAVVLVAAAGVYFTFGRAAPASGPAPPSAAAFASAAKAMDGMVGTPGAARAADGPPPVAAGSMESAVASLQSRLAKGGGTVDDWELLAKSFEFLGRPGDAVLARAHRLPGMNSGAPVDSGAARPAAASGAAVSGEVTLAAGLAAKTIPGETLYIVASSVDSPGIPVAVMRASVGNWPLKFTLDDSQSMLPGRTLSTTGRVTVEARISQQGQPLPSRGDLQGSSGVIDPSSRQPLKIVIDRVIS